MKRHAKKRGFTLVELLVTITAAAVLVLALSLILFMTYRSWRTNNEYVQLRRNMAFAVQVMAKEIRSSSFSGITAANNSLQLATNAVRPNLTVFTRNPASSNLTGSIYGTLINKGLRVFTPQKQTNGVLLQLEMANGAGDIVITDKTFIYARN